MGSLLRTLVILSVLIFSFESPVGNPFPPTSTSPGFVKIFVVKHTWHTGIILKTGFKYDPFVALENTFKGAEYIEVGWGDYDFFRSEKATVGMAVKAMLWPTKSVLHIIPYYRQPSLIFEDTHLVELLLPEEGYRKLLNYITISFSSDQNFRIIPLESENTVGGQFYLSDEKYHLFKTCNVWTARAIKTGGFPIAPFYALSSKNVMKQIRKQLKKNKGK